MAHQAEAVTHQPPTTPVFANAGVDFVSIWRTLRKYWSTALITATAISLAVVFYTLGQKKIYEATTVIQFDPNPPRPLGGRVEQIVELGTGPMWDAQEYYETQFHIIQSMKVAKAVVAELGLQRDPGFLLNLAPGASSKGHVDEISEENAADILKSRLKVDPVKSSRLATIRYQDASPERAARILSSIVDTYVTQNVDDALASTTSAADWLRDQLDKLKVDLESSEMALHDFKLHKNILSVAFDDQSNMLREEMTLLNQTLTSVHARREELSARCAQLAKVDASNLGDLPASEFLQSSLLQTLRNRFLDVERDYNSLLASGKGEQHPDVMSARVRVEDSKNALFAEIKNIQGALNRDLAVVVQQERGLSGLFDKAKTQALDLNLLEIEYNRLRRAKENTNKLYSLVLERSKESDLTRMLRVNNIRIVDRPRIPRSAVRPNVAINIGAGLVIGVLLGMSAAMGRALMDRTMKTPDDIELVTKAPFLGLIPEIDESSRLHKKQRRSRQTTSGSQELMVHELPMSGIAEASRSIRTNLMFMAPDKPYRTLLVTSGGPAEGKTTVACFIAIAMAQAGKRVVLIDCDLRRPRVHKIFKVPSETGLTNALVGIEPEGRKVDAASVARPTQVPNLSVVPAGPLPPNPAELLQSDRFKVYLKELLKEFDQIILDSPPLVAVTDATILSAFVDGTVLVVRAFETRKDLARHAMRGLRDVGATVAGVVLNAVNLTRDEYRYAYQYYRRYNYYSSHTSPDGTPDRGHDAAPPPPT